MRVILDITFGDGTHAYRNIPIQLTNEQQFKSGVQAVKVKEVDMNR